MALDRSVHRILKAASTGLCPIASCPRAPAFQPYPPSVCFPPGSQSNTVKTVNAAHVPPLLQAFQCLPISLGIKAKVHIGPRPPLTWPPTLSQPLLPLTSYATSFFLTASPSSFSGLLTVPQTQGFSTSALLTFWAGTFFVVGAFEDV